MIIAIDGPAGSGKSTVAKLVATHLGFAYLDTGAMYRAVTIRVFREGLNPYDEFTVASTAQKALITFRYSEGDTLPSKVFIDDVDVTKAIRTSVADRFVSQISAMPAVRAALSEQQRRLGNERDTVMEGRDIGTVVFPDAELKVFLTATPEVRAHRRALQNIERGLEQVDEAVILAEIEARDAFDSSREVAPLVAAKDAVVIDTTNLTIEEVVERITELVVQRRAGATTSKATL